MGNSSDSSNSGPQEGAAGQRKSRPPEFVRALEEFCSYLASERGRSDHTVRAYEGDITGLLDYAAGQVLNADGGFSLRRL